MLAVPQPEVCIQFRLTVPPLVGVLLVVIYSYIVQDKLHELAETTFRASAMRNATLVETLTAMDAIKAHGAESQMQSRLEDTASFLARVSSQMLSYARPRPSMLIVISSRLSTPVKASLV